MMMDDPFGTVHFLPFQSVDGNCFIGQPSAGNVSQPFWVSNLYKTLGTDLLGSATDRDRFK